MKLLKLSCYVSASLIIALNSARAEDRQAAPAIVARNCSGCHELNGGSQLPYIPRLAGLGAPYIDRKLSNFRAAHPTPVVEAVGRLLTSGVKSTPVTRTAAANMVGVAHAMSPEDRKAAVDWYAGQLPTPGRGSSRKLVEQGRTLFANGAPSPGVPACSSCHGPDAEGTAKAPRLAGQNAGYLVAQLALFHAGDPDCSPEMTEVARNLGSGQARAIAAYLQSR